MRSKNAYGSPETKLITEKYLLRVLASSICSIFLCMACLAGSTWAWYTVSVENTENVIQVASVTNNVLISRGSEKISPSDNGAFTLDPGKYDVFLEVTNEATEQDGLGKKKGPVYVLMTTSNEQYFLLTFANGEGTKEAKIEVKEEPVNISFSVLRMVLVSAEPVDDETIIIDGKSTDLLDENEKKNPETAEKNETDTVTTEKPAEAETTAATEASTETE